MRVMWKGAISFGLVTIPVKVFGATETLAVGFHQLHDRDHDRDHGRIQCRRYCSECGEEVPFEHIVRGHELGALDVRSNHTIDILQFVDPVEIDPVYFQRSYYLVPEKMGAKAYRLLRDAMRGGGRVGGGQGGLPRQGAPGDGARARRRAGARDHVLAG
ncbi:MAG: Ku protein [Thermoleophilia bacterium]